MALGGARKTATKAVAKYTKPMKQYGGGSRVGPMQPAKKKTKVVKY